MTHEQQMRFLDAISVNKEKFTPWKKFELQTMVAYVKWIEEFIEEHGTPPSTEWVETWLKKQGVEFKEESQ